MIQVQIDWLANPFRGDKFAEGWLPAAEAVLDFGATEWSFTRALDGRLDFIQTALFPSKAHFERYWYSERIAEYRIELSGHLPGADPADVLGDRGRRRGRQPCSSGAIVSPASFSCSQ